MEYRTRNDVVEQKVDFVSKSTAPTIDDLASAVKNRTLVASEHVKNLFETHFKKNRDFPAEQFNFGNLPYKVIVDAQRDAIEFVRHGLFMPPYDLCIYRVNIEYESHTTVGTTLLNVTSDVKGEGVATVLFCMSQDFLVAQHSINTLAVGKPTPGAYSSMPPTTKFMTDADGDAVKLELPQEEWRFWRDTMRNMDNNPPSPADLCDGAMLMMGLTMILNTRGVFKDRAEPPRKSNLNRARQGRPLLPYVTHVRTAAYAKSTTDTHAPGTHASPRPHRRRAHVRHYVRDGREWHTPIEAMLVNWDGSPLQRGQYDVS
jgi:hypothetical protein